MLRPELEQLPERLKSLPVDKRGYPVPWFVAWINGEPEFRAMDSAKWRSATKDRLCWVCGGRLGSYLAFTIGPMCGINRTTTEPPAHRECAEWSIRNCPFLSRPHMIRRTDETMPEDAKSIGGLAIKRNPGVTLLWITRDFKVFKDGQGGHLIEVGEPKEMRWYACGRPATRAEVEQSVITGLPSLVELAVTERGAMAELDRRRAWLEERYPAA